MDNKHSASNMIPLNINISSSSNSFANTNTLLPEMLSQVTDTHLPSFNSIIVSTLISVFI